ncbi:MAG: hypothetical protein ACJ72N_11490 [Labedaea sp.]
MIPHFTAAGRSAVPVIASQIVAAVANWAGRILTYTLALVDSLADLSKLLSGLAAMAPRPRNPGGEQQRRRHKVR